MQLQTSICFLLKVLMESFISLRIMYALPVWGTPSSRSPSWPLTTYTVRVVFSLKKFDHVSVPREQLGWPNISEEIEIRSLVAFHCHYFSCQCLQLQPPITFGRSHTYNTWCKAYLLTAITIIWLEHSNIFDIVPLAGGISYHLQCPVSMENILLLQRLTI